MAFLDTFTRSDADTLGSPWTYLDGQSLGSKFGIRSGKAVYVGPMDESPAVPSDAFSTQFALVDVGSADMAVEWNVSDPDNGGSLYFPFRYAPGTAPTFINNMLGLYSTSVLDDRLHLATPSSTLDTVDVPGWRTGDTIRVEAVGTQILVFIDGTQVISTTTSQCLTNTYAGIGGNATTNGPMRAKWISGTGIGSATVDVGSNVQTVEWEWSALSKGPSFHFFRFSDNNNSWFVSGTGSNATTLYLFQRSGGTNTQRAVATGVTWGPGHTLRVEAGASSIVVKSGGTTVITHYVAASGGTRAGIGGNMSDRTMGTTRWTRFAANAFTAGFDGDAGSSLGHPWTNHAGVWGVEATNTHNATRRSGELDHARWTRFSCTPWPAPRRAHRNLGLVRGARG